MYMVYIVEVASKIQSLQSLLCEKGTRQNMWELETFDVVWHQVPAELGQHGKGSERHGHVAQTASGAVPSSAGDST